LLDVFLNILSRDLFGFIAGRMSQMRKSFYPPSWDYEAYLAGWAFAFAVVLVTFMAIEHGVHF